MIGGSLASAAGAARACARRIGIRITEPKVLGFAEGGALDPLLDHYVVEVARAEA